MRLVGRAIESDLGELAHIAWTRRWWLLATSLIAGLVALVSSFLVTPRYHSVASILPAKGLLQEHEIVIGRGESLGAIELRPTTATNGMNLVTASSFRVRAMLTEQLNLVEFFGHSALAARDSALATQQAMDDLRRASHFGLSMYRDVLFINVSTRDPEMSARIANCYVGLIEQENLTRYQNQARQLVVYLEGQLRELNAELTTVADSVAAFYQASGLVDIEGAREERMSLMRSLQLQRSAAAQMLARESLDRAPGDPAIARLAAQLGVFDEMLTSLSPSRPGRQTEPLWSVGDPAAVLKAQELERQLRLLQAREASLRGELAAVVMESERESGHLPLLDRAFPSSKPYWPRRWLMTIAAAAAAGGVLFLAFLLAASAASIRRSEGG